MKKRKMLPAFLMLSAGGAVSITMFIMQYDTKTMLLILLAVLIIFFVLGKLIQKMLDKFDENNQENLIDEVESEGEVTENEVLSDNEEIQVEDLT